MCHFSAPKKASSHDWLNSYLLRVFGLQPRLDHGIWSNVGKTQMAVCQNLVPLVNIKIAGKWMFIPLKMVLIGIDPYPNQPPVGYYQFLYSMVFYATIDGFWFTSSSFILNAFDVFSTTGDPTSPRRSSLRPTAQCGPSKAISAWQKEWNPFGPREPGANMNAL